MTSKRQIMSEPFITETPGSIKFDWFQDDEMALQAFIEYLSDSSKGVTGEFNFSHIFDEFPPIRHLHINLLSTNARRDVTKRLEALELPVEFNFRSLVDQVCDAAIDLLRKEIPYQNINLPPSNNGILDYLLYPFLIRNEPTTIYGAGGSAKSLLADLMAVMIQFNVTTLGWLVKAGNVLYLDWETNANTHRRNINAIKSDLGIEDNTEILYQFVERDLTSDIERIHKIVVEKKVDLVIIDSQMAASANPRPGLDSSQVASAYYNALRTLHTTTLTIDHLPKTAMSEFGSNDTAYGSVVKYNRTRKQFLVKRTQEPGDNTIELALINNKFNLGNLHKPIGLSVNFTQNGTGILEKIKFNDCALVDNPILAKALPLWQRIAAELKYNPQTLENLSDALESPQSSIKVVLYRKKDMFVRVGNNEWGLLERQVTM